MTDPAAPDAVEAGTSADEPGSSADVPAAAGEQAAAPASPPRREIADDWDDVEAQKAERESKRLRQTVRDMVLSMAVVSVVVLFLVAPWNWNPPDPVKVVDWQPVVTGARDAYDWPVLAPAGLASGWRATSARIETAGDGLPVVVVGWLTPDEQFLGLQQSQTRMTDFPRTASVQGSPTGAAVVIGGRSWERWQNADETRRSLVAQEGDVTYVVTGMGDWASIDAFAAKLRAG
jgi:hypothetical protein